MNKITLLHQVGISNYFMKKMHGQTILHTPNSFRFLLKRFSFSHISAFLNIPFLISGLAGVTGHCLFNATNKTKLILIPHSLEATSARLAVPPKTVESGRSCCLAAVHTQAAFIKSLLFYQAVILHFLTFVFEDYNDVPNVYCRSQN